MTLSRDATEAAFQRHKDAHDARRWTDLADLFREDGIYEEPFFGRIEGRDEIRDFLRRSMRGLDEWVFPLQWIVVAENRVVTQWLNRLPKQRRDGGHFEFAGISNIVYDDEGMIVSQSDIYDRIDAMRVITESKSGLLERVNDTVVRAGTPVVELAKRLTGYA